MDKNKIIKSLFYKFTERFAVKGVGMVIGILLARLIAPEVFGQVVILTVCADLSLTLVEGGLNTALVQSRECDDRDYSTVFYITLVLSGAVIAAMQFLAPLIARFYKSPEMALPLRVYIFSLLFSSFNSIQVAQLQRDMRFREMMFCSLAATVAAGSLGPRWSAPALPCFWCCAGCRKAASPGTAPGDSTALASGCWRPL